MTTTMSFGVQSVQQNVEWRELLEFWRFLEEETGDLSAVGLDLRTRLDERASTGSPSVVVGFTGTGGAGKSSVVDELVRRFRNDFP